MSKDEIINNTISKFHEECSKLPKDDDFLKKLHEHEEIMIKVILETVLNNQ